ncbi:uncharacterized protein LOC122507656 isoform X3 [Leptopilina heterotoma]|uniref:uncharacterized protein LOC122507656 isoform X3 n=1 Tax=Leptopilina heterotoma TaxID=63436 RepID=UPI001CA7ED2E|nr:uncharacterized protein LOC122507656 isoform X3 [Leptopilina heterotoma]
MFSINNCFTNLIFNFLNTCLANIVTGSKDASSLFDYIKNNCQDIEPTLFSPGSEDDSNIFDYIKEICQGTESTINLSDIEPTIFLADDRRTEADKSVLDNNPLEKNRFPYQDSTGKVELWPDSKVWIYQNELNKIMDLPLFYPRTFIRPLLENLIGINELHHFSRKLKNPEELPKNVQLAVLKFVKDIFKTKKNLTDALLKKALRRTLLLIPSIANKGKSVLDSNALEKNHFPYQDSTGKVELWPDSTVYIYKHELDRIMDLPLLYPRTLIRELLENLIGINELHHFSRKLKNPKELPKKVRVAVFSFVKDHFKTKNLTETVLKNSLSVILRTIPSFSNKVTENSDLLQQELFSFEDSAGKVELWPKSNIWIIETVRDDIKKESNLKLVPLMRILLQNLIGKGKFHLIETQRRKGAKKLPPNFKITIYAFLKDVLKNERITKKSLDAAFNNIIHTEMSQYWKGEH